VHPAAGAYAALGLSLQVLIAALLMPLVLPFLLSRLPS
jgi:putative effector of murein hydrolase